MIDAPSQSVFGYQCLDHRSYLHWVLILSSVEYYQRLESFPRPHAQAAHNAFLRVTVPTTHTSGFLHLTPAQMRGLRSGARRPLLADRYLLTDFDRFLAASLSNLHWHPVPTKLRQSAVGEACPWKRHMCLAGTVAAQLHSMMGTARRRAHTRSARG